LIYHIFKILPTSFVAERGPGLRICRDHHAQREPRANAGHHGQGGRDLKSTPGVQTRTVVTGYSLLDSGFQDQCSTIFVTFSDFDERYKNIDTAKTENVRRNSAGIFRRRPG